MCKFLKLYVYHNTINTFKIYSDRVGCYEIIVLRFVKQDQIDIQHTSNTSMLRQDFDFTIQGPVK